jgi:hypothetical protein
MELQKVQDPTLKIPKIVTFLTNAVHELNGSTSEGIFRVPGDADAVTDLVCIGIIKKNVNQKLTLPHVAYSYRKW